MSILYFYSIQTFSKSNISYYRNTIDNSNCSFYENHNYYDIKYKIYKKPILIKSDKKKYSTSDHQDKFNTIKSYFSCNNILWLEKLVCNYRNPNTINLFEFNKKLNLKKLWLVSEFEFNYKKFNYKSFLIKSDSICTYITLKKVDDKWFCFTTNNEVFISRIITGIKPEILVNILKLGQLDKKLSKIFKKTQIKDLDIKRFCNHFLIAFTYKSPVLKDYYIDYGVDYNKLYGGQEAKYNDSLQFYKSVGVKNSYITDYNKNREFADFKNTLPHNGTPEEKLYKYLRSKTENEIKQHCMGQSAPEMRQRVNFFNSVNQTIRWSLYPKVKLNLKMSDSLQYSVIYYRERTYNKGSSRNNPSRIKYAILEYSKREWKVNFNKDTRILKLLNLLGRMELKVVKNIFKIGDPPTDPVIKKCIDYCYIEQKVNRSGFNKLDIDKLLEYDQIMRDDRTYFTFIRSIHALEP